MGAHCQVCFRPLGGLSGVAQARESLWQLASTSGIVLDDLRPICEPCLLRLLRAHRHLAAQEPLQAQLATRQRCMAAWEQMFVSDAPAPPGVLDLGHISAYGRVADANLDTALAAMEIQVINALKNLTLMRRGDAIYHLCLRLTGIGHTGVMMASGCAARTGRVTPALVEAWDLLDASRPTPEPTAPAPEGPDASAALPSQDAAGVDASNPPPPALPGVSHG